MVERGLQFEAIELMLAPELQAIRDITYRKPLILSSDDISQMNLRDRGQ